MDCFLLPTASLTRGSRVKNFQQRGVESNRSHRQATPPTPNRELQKGNSELPLLPPAIRLLLGPELAGPARIRNENVNKVAPIEVKDIIVAFVVPPRSSDAPPPFSCHRGLGTV